MYLSTFYSIEMIAPLLGRVYHYSGGGKQLETTLAVQGNKSCEVLKIKHHLPVYHLFLLALNENARPFFPPKFRSLSFIHSVTAALKIHIKALAEKANCQALLQCRSRTRTFFFLGCAKGHAYSPQNTNPSHQQGGRYNGQAKAAIPVPHMVMLLVSTEVGNNMSPPIVRSLQRAEKMVSNTQRNTQHVQILLSLLPTTSPHSP